MPCIFLGVEFVVRLKHIAFEVPLPVVSRFAPLHKVAFREVRSEGSGSCAEIVMEHVNAVVAQLRAVGSMVLGAIVLATIERVFLAPVEDDIVVEDIFHLCVVVVFAVGEVCFVAHSVKTGSAVEAVANEAIAHRAVLSAPLRGVGAAALLVLGVVESLADDAPLYGG